jgi:WD40 repeat protein
MLQVWDLKTGQLLRRLEGHNGAVTALVFANSIKLLFSASVDAHICIWTETGAKLQASAVQHLHASAYWLLHRC